MYRHRWYTRTGSIASGVSSQTWGYFNGLTGPEDEYFKQTV
jgi:hypothetical protein